MAYMSQFVQLNYDFSQTVPDSDPDMEYYNGFKKTFGEDGNVFAVGLKDSSIFQLENFNAYQKLTQEVLTSLQIVHSTCSDRSKLVLQFSHSSL